MKNAFICYYTEKYKDGVRALKNSHRYWNHEADLLIRDVTGKSNGKLDRWIEAYTTEDYDNVCILDADMFFTRNVDKYFKIANMGLIAGAHNNSFHNFKQLEIEDKFINVEQITNVPLFIEAGHPLLKQIINWWEEKGVRSDFECTNLSLLDWLDDLFTFPAYLWTNIHHTMLKPETCAIWKYDRLMSRTNEPVNMVHGKFWDKNYTDNLVKVMVRVYHNDEAVVKIATDSRDLLLREFEKYFNMEF